MDEEVLRRFHGALVEALQRRDAEHMGRPFTVAEIYQDLVPYAVYREALGVEMNGDYEHALLRLLSGEGGLVELESEAALRQIRDELESNNPNTGLFREFAAVDARLNMARILDAAPVALAPGPELNESDAVESETAMDDSDTQSEIEMESDGFQQVPLGAFAASGPLDPEMVDAPAGGRAEASESNSPEVCRWCRESLPQRDNLNYCPFCGTDVTLVPCQSCGEAVEANWRFCITCGTKAPEEG
jgi:hypothetical protein